MSLAVFNDIYQQCEQVSPYLKGEILVSDRPDSALISYHASNLASIRSLHQSIQQQSPEAGQAYWLTRSWDLLTWQPLYVAITAIYHCQVLPDLCNMSQRHQDGVVAGFCFSCTDCDTGEYHQLVSAAGQQLMTIFEHFRQELDQSVRCRPRFVEHLIADALLSRLLLLQHTNPEFSATFIRQQAALWLDALSLPDEHLEKIQHSPIENQLVFTRSSCCSVYKTQAGQKCANCPKLKQKSV